MSNSVTDIAARVALDYSDFMQGMKQVEQRFVDFSKSTASPFYPGSAPDQGAAHVDAYKAQDKIAEQKLIQETIAARNREEMLMASLRREQQMRIENVSQTAAAEQEINERSAALQAAIRERFAKEEAGWIAQQAKVNAEIIKKFNEDADEYLKRAETERHQQWINNYNEKHKFYAAAVANMQATADAETAIAKRSADLRLAIESRYTAEVKALQEAATQDTINQYNITAARLRRIKEETEVSQFPAARLRDISQKEEESARFSASLKADMEARYADDVKQYWINSYNDAAKARKEITAQEIADAKKQAEMLAKLRFDWIEPRTQEGQDFSNNLRTQMEAESLAEREKQREIYRQRAIERDAKVTQANAENLKQTLAAEKQATEDRKAAGAKEVQQFLAERQRRIERARELDNKAYEENKSLQERAFRDGQKIRQNQAAVDERAAKEAAQRAKEINAPQEDAHVIAYRTQQEREANDQRQRGLALVRSLVTAQDLHNERVQEYTNLRRNNIITEQQYAAAVSRSAVIMNASNIGAGRFSGAMTQMSFAVEDFIQVTAMGGGLNMALMSASNNISMVVRALIPASSLLGTIAGSAIPLVLVGAGMMASKFLETKSAVEQLNEELSKLRDNSYIDIRISSAIDFESVKNIRSYEEGMRQAAAAADDLRKAQLEERLARNAANSAIEKTIMGLEEAQAIVTSQTGPTDMSAEYVDYSAEGERAMQAYQDAYAEMNREIVNGINTQADARRVLTEFTNAISNQTLGSGGSEIFADQIELLQQILKQGSESELMKFFDDIEKQNARVFDAEQKIEESRKRAEEARVRAIESAKEELRIKQQEQLLLMGMTDQEKERYDLMKERNQFIGFDPQAVAGLGLSGALQAGQGMATGMLFLESKAAQLEKEIQTLQQSSSPEIVGGMQQNAFDAQADAFKQIFAAANKQPNPQLTRQIQLLQDIKTAVQQGGVLQIVQ